MKVAYITAQTPYGKKEQFILPEIIEFVNRGNEVLVLPVRPEKELFEGEEPKTVSNYTISIPLYSKGVILLGIVLFLRSPIRSLKLIGRILFKSGSPKKVIKNLSIFGKGITLSEVVSRNGVEHIHAHWAGTTATAAYIASYFSEIPWSFTCHRWDIAENNMLKEKVKSAKFVRVINDNGFNEIVNIVGEIAKEKCHKLHSGVNIKLDKARKVKEESEFTIVVPGNLIEVKGHTYLIDTIALLVKNGYKLRCNLYGNGYLEETLKNKVSKLGLNETIKFYNKLAHDKLLSMYDEGKVHCVILPSIVTLTEKEGIPVSLMEAMAYKIPVIATRTGGIPELLDNGAGILVNEKDHVEMANSIIKLMEDRGYYDELAEKGYNKVYEEFYLPNIVERLIELMK